MKPGEFVRWNGRSVRALMIQCRYQDGYEAIIGPDSPDYALAVAALQSLIRPSLDPRAGRVLAMREVMSDGIPEEVLRAFTERFGGEYRRLARWPWPSLWHYNGPRP